MVDIVEITRDILINLLNMDLELEYSAAVQYVNHASLITRADKYLDISKEIALDALEEIEHAIIVARQISHLGGIPSVNVARVFTSNNYNEMFLHDIEDEEDAIRRYTIRVSQAELLKEYTLSQHLQKIIEMEKEHANDFKYKQRQRQRKRNFLIMEKNDHDDFSKKWAERALQVPIRTKKHE